MKQYVAFISVPIFAEDDDSAFEQAGAYANSLKHKDSAVIAGHVEVIARDNYADKDGPMGIDFRGAIQQLCEGLPGVRWPLKVDLMSID